MVEADFGFTEGGAADHAVGVYFEVVLRRDLVEKGFVLLESGE